MSFDRILELGCGKEIKEILDHLDAKTGCVSQENSVSRHSRSLRQNLLLSATLNEKVNHLAKMKAVVVVVGGGKFEYQIKN